MTQRTAIPLIVAHRGASHAAPENTHAAIEEAWIWDADAVEIDVRLTRDRQIVAIHDADTSRTSGQSLTVAENDYELLSQLDVGRWKSAAHSGEQIPLLRDILDRLPPQKQLLVELKCGEEITKPLVAELAAQKNLQQQVVIIGFNAMLVSEVKRKIPSLSALLCVRAVDAGENRWSSVAVERLIDAAHHLGLDGVDLDAAIPIDVAAVQQLHAANLSCHFWTVDDPEQSIALKEAGVDGLTTNRPGWLREQLGCE